MEKRKISNNVLRKHADLSRHKIIIPKYYIEKFGSEYIMECYKDYMILKPVKEVK